MYSRIRLISTKVGVEVEIEAELRDHLKKNGKKDDIVQKGGSGVGSKSSFLTL